MTTLNDIKPGQHFVVATEGMRGHFACEMWLNNQDFEGECFPEPWSSDFMTYATEAEAISRAKDLAAELDVPYVS
jgi:hypothetical protein